MWNPFKKDLNPVRKLAEQTKKDWEENVQPYIDQYNKNIVIGSSKPKIYSYYLKLTKTELLALESCINFATKGCKIIRIEPNLRKAVHMKALTDKGYLVRVKKGHYQLSFYGTKRT